MYKKVKYTKEEKRIIPTIIVFILIQALIIYGFLLCWEDRHPLDIKDTEQITITVEKVYVKETFFGHRSTSKSLIVASKTDEFAFHSGVSAEGYPNWKLEDLISKGDTLTLTFIRNERWGGGIHTVVAAKTETETYRTFEGYNRGSKLTPYLIIFAFFTLESLFLGVVFLYFLMLPIVLQDIKKKRLKNAKRKKKYKEKQKAEKLEAKNI